MPPFILTCPASRGVGFELTRRLLKTTQLPIIATARSNLEETHHKLSEGLNVKDGRLEVLKVDVTGKHIKTLCNCPIPYDRTLPNPLHHQMNPPSKPPPATANPASPTPISASHSPSPESFTRRNHPPKSPTRTHSPPSKSTLSAHSSS